MPVLNLRDAGSAGFFDRECDVCVVGTGPAGATLARELSGSQLRVTVLESGDRERLEENDLLNAVESVGRPRVADQWAVRNRIVGGSSHTWSGRCAPFDAIDFESRGWVPGSGWPFGLDELEPYLDRSAAHLGLAVGTGFNDERFWSLTRRRPPSSSPEPGELLPFFWQFSRGTDSPDGESMRFGRNLAERLGANITLVTGATVLRVETDDAARRVRSVSFAMPDGTRGRLTARTVVLCAGGIENARILLASDSVAPRGLGNDRDLVGRTLMDHPRGSIGSFDVTDSAALRKAFGRFTVRGHLFLSGFRLSPDLQRRKRLLNAAAWMGESVADDDPWSALRSLIRGGRGQHALLDAARNSRLLVRGARQYIGGREGVPRKYSELTLDCMVEQRPDPASRVTLSDRRDRFGMRIPRIDWRSHPEESRTVRQLATTVVSQLERMGLPVPSLSEWVREEGELPTSFADVAHPTGTTRMSVDPNVGVVDPQGQVHGVDRLYIAGSSVFPTVGHCNPTEMIVALTIRLADRLKQQARADEHRVHVNPNGSDTGPIQLTGAMSPL